jgi:hypothetical protein
MSGTGAGYLKFLSGLARDRGEITMIKYAKLARLYVVSHLSGQPLKKKTQGIKLTKDWLPSALGDLLRIVRRGTTAEKRWLLTILYSTRALAAGRTPKYEDITAHSLSVVSDISRDVKSFWRAIGFNSKRKLEVEPHTL